MLQLTVYDLIFLGDIKVPAQKRGNMKDGNNPTKTYSQKNREMKMWKARCPLRSDKVETMPFSRSCGFTERVVSLLFT